MENALLIALSRQSALRNQLDVVANNMANINTTGFKSQRMLFEEFIMPVAEATELSEEDDGELYRPWPRPAAEVPPPHARSPRDGAWFGPCRSRGCAASATAKRRS